MYAGLVMKCLIVIDMQRDFIGPSAPVEVPGAYELGPRILSMVDDANRHGWLTVATQDWHPSDHVSFYTSYPGTPPHQETSDGREIPTTAPATPATSALTPPSNNNNNKSTTSPLFPPHCIADTTGAQLVPSLQTAKFDLIMKKGQTPEIESFSAFADAQGHSTGLGEWLQSHNVSSIALAGVATRYCVYSTASDALLKWSYGPEHVAVVADGVAGVNPGAALHALQEIRRLGGVVEMWHEIVHDWLRRGV